MGQNAARYFTAKPPFAPKSRYLQSGFVESGVPRLVVTCQYPFWPSTWRVLRSPLGYLSLQTETALTIWNATEHVLLTAFA
jgi:hypothetical protein